MIVKAKDDGHKSMARCETAVAEKVEKASRWWQDTKESVKTAVEKTQNFVEKIGNSIKEGLNDCATKVKEGLKVLTEGAKGVWNAVTNFVEEHPFIATGILIVGLAALTFFTGGAASAIFLAATKGAIMGAISGFGSGVVTAGVKKLVHGDSYSFDDAVHDVGKSTFGGALFGAITGGTVEAGKQLWSKVGGKITNALGKSANKTSYGNASGTSAYQGRSGTATSTTREGIVSVESKTTNPEFSEWLNKGNAENKVYFGIKDGQAQYTGITKQPIAARLSQHNNMGKGFSTLEVQFTDLTRNQARAIEQYYINNGPNALNKINSISPNSPFYAEALEWAEAFIMR